MDQTGTFNKKYAGKSDYLEPELNDLSRLSNLEGLSETEITAEITVPAEGGWGWVVVASSFMCMFILDGIFLTFGSIYEDMAADLETEGSLIALVNSVAVALYFISGPIISAFINRYGFRTCAMIGSVIVSVSYLVAQSTRHYVMLLFFYGIIPGFGGCFIYMSSQLVIGFYFERLRALAMSLGGLGQSFGITVLSTVNTQLVQLAGWRVTTLFHSGLFGIIFFLAMAFQPLISLYIATEKEDTTCITYLPSLSTMKLLEPREDKEEAATSQTKLPTRTERLFKAVSNRNFPTAAEVFAEDKEILDFKETKPGPSGPKVSIISLVPERNADGKVLKKLRYFKSHTNTIDEVPQYEDYDSEQTEDKFYRMNDKELQRQYETRHDEDDENEFPRKWWMVFCCCHQRKHINDSIYQNDEETEPPKSIVKTDRRTHNTMDKKKLKITEEEPLYYDSVQENMSLTRYDKDLEVGDESRSWWQTCPCCRWHRHVAQSRPMYRDDAFYQGNVENLPVYRKSVVGISPEERTGLEYQMAVSRAVTTADLQDRRGIFTTAARRVLATMMDPQLLKKHSFIMVCSTGFLIHVGLLVPYVFLADRNKLQGIDPAHCNLFVSVMGISNAMGRVIGGILACKLNPLIIYSTACLTAGVAVIASNFSYIVCYQYTCCVIFGTSAALISTLRSLVIVKLFGLEKLTNATGLLLMFQGFGSLLSTPLASLLKNVSGYFMAFIVAGAFITIGGVLICKVNRDLKHEEVSAKEDRTCTYLKRKPSFET